MSNLPTTMNNTISKALKADSVGQLLLNTVVILRHVSSFQCNSKYLWVFFLSSGLDVFTSKVQKVHVPISRGLSEIGC